MIVAVVVVVSEVGVVLVLAALLVRVGHQHLVGTVGFGRISSPRVSPCSVASRQSRAGSSLDRGKQRNGLAGREGSGGFLLVLDFPRSGTPGALREMGCCLLLAIASLIWLSIIQGGSLCSVVRLQRYSEEHGI